MPHDVLARGAIDEAVWRFTAAECRLLLAMRQRAKGDASGSAEMHRLFGELADAAERLRVAACSPDDAEALHRPVDPTSSIERNGSFTAARQSGRR